MSFFRKKRKEPECKTATLLADLPSWREYKQVSGVSNNIRAAYNVPREPRGLVKTEDLKEIVEIVRDINHEDYKLREIKKVRRARIEECHGNMHCLDDEEDYEDDEEDYEDDENLPDDPDEVLTAVMYPDSYDIKAQGYYEDGGVGPKNDFILDAADLEAVIDAINARKERLLIKLAEKILAIQLKQKEGERDEAKAGENPDMAT